MVASTAILLAAGLGTRMNSSRPKVLHPLGGEPMLRLLLRAAARAFERVVVVAGPDMEEVARVAAPHAVVVQTERRGTAHAALAARDALRDGGEATILYADNPLLTAETMDALRDHRRARNADLALVAMRPADPGAYGRVIEADGTVRRIVEWADADAAERRVGLCNGGVVTAAAGDLLGWLERVGDDNAKREYYLTDVVAIANRDGRRVVAYQAPDPDELHGVNSRAELARAEAILQARLRRRAMDGGATLVAPDTVFLSFDTALAADVLVEPHVVFGTGVAVASGAWVRAFSHLEGASVGPGATVGPYARLRPGTTVGAGAHVGNFVELKAATLGTGAKANHLAYLGDATVGAGANIGAGTITCNYDGAAKHRTTIGRDAFVGSDAVLVAPVAIGDGALVAAGSVITADVPDAAMAFGRARQTNKDDGATRFRQRARSRGGK